MFKKWGQNLLSSEKSVPMMSFTSDIFIVQKIMLRNALSLSNTSLCICFYKDLKLLTVVSVLIYELYVIFNNKFFMDFDIHGRNTRQNGNYTTL